MQDHAGVPGPAGLPETTAPARPRWWRTPRHPRLVLAVAMLAALVASAGITVILTAGGGSHRPLAAGARLGAEPPDPASTAVPASAVPASTVPASTVPASTAPSSTAPSSTSPAPTTTAYLTGPASPPAGASGPASPPGHPTPPPAPPSSSPSSSPAQGYLQVAPGNLRLTSKAGQPASGFFILTAANGPVAQYTVRVGAKAAKISVAPAAGSLPAGSFVEVTVTVTSKAALSTQVMVEPGNLSLTVVYQPKPKPAPTPTGGGGGG